MNKSILTNEYIIGLTLLLSGFYLESEGRNVSASLFNLGAVVLFSIDLFKKVKNVKKLKEDISNSEEQNKEKE